MKIVKEVVRVGNTGGVLVPRGWVNGKAEVQLVEKPLDVEADVLDILKPFLPDVKGVYITGSYARGEETARSDVDILAITGRITRRLRHGKYQVILISEKELEHEVMVNAIPLLPMIREAKPILNAELLENYKMAPLTRKNLRWHIETTRSALAVLKTALALDEETGEKVSDDTIYSIILRLRSMYIIDCLRRGITPTNNGLLSLIRKLSGSMDVYEAYLRSKDGMRARRSVSLEAAKHISKYIDEKTAEQRTWE